MTKANVFKRFTFLAFFMLGVLGSRQSAFALEQPIIVPAFAVSDAGAAQSFATLKDFIKKVIIGSDNYGQAQAMLPSTDVNGKALPQEKLRNNGTFQSLAEYYENVWWPRYLAANQMIAKENAGKDAMAMAGNGRIVGAQTNIDWAQDVKKISSNINGAFIGGQDVLCPALSLSQSQFVLGVMAQQSREAAQQQSAARYSGSKSAAGATAANKGPAINALKMVQETNTNKTCVKDGNDGANAGWCTSGVNGTDPTAASHVLATTLMGQTALRNDSKFVNNLTNAQMFINRLFPGVFSPIRADLLKPLSTQAAEVINAQDAYIAALNVFQYPFNKMKADNQPVPGITSQKYIEALYKQMEVPDSVKKNILGDGGTSLAGAERGIFKDHVSDITSTMKDASWDLPNLTRIVQLQSRSQIILLYDIREELKVTNALLGALGSAATRDTYNEVQAKTAAISGK